ncbi:MAG: putative DNA-binding domain-containing protein [Methylococcaceae bacterium]
MNANFQDKQRAFASYIRNPNNSPVPKDVNAERIAVYSELFFNNIDGFLASCFPVLKTLLDDNQWQQLARDFFATHQCKTPYFSEIAQEFLYYLQNERDTTHDYAFIIELAHYEWVEMALSIAKDELIINTLPIKNLLTQKISVSDLTWVLVYQYPVHKISPEYLPEQPPEQTTFLIVHRDSDYQVHFFTITPLTYRLLEIIQENNIILTTDCLNQLALESGTNPDIIITHGLQILMDLAEKHIIVIENNLN